MPIQVDPKPSLSKATPAVVIAVLLLIGFVLAVAWRWILFVLLILAVGAGYWLAHS